ncbi:MAG: hypothetical protein AAF650_10835 [Pseudomonadota bacterium]
MSKVFLIWCALCVALHATAGWYGYSPFGDGVQARNIYSRGGGPTHK